jgi:cytochrome c oxidase accessory protein FixG
MKQNTFKELKLKDTDNSDFDEPDKLITETGVSYRDRVSNIDTEGKRIWIYPKKPSGKFHNLRIGVSILLLVIMFATPFIKINGNPFVLLNILERKFIIFGVIFWPQDFHIFALSFLAFVIFVVLFTAVYGRIWCGWACPQTVFMEMVFRKIEYWIEGDAKQQMTLDQSTFSGNKFLKKTLKHSIFIVLAFIINNLVLSYIIGVDTLAQNIFEGPSKHLSTFIAVVLISGVFYLVYSWFREQACTFVCPYGRLQSVLLDKNSIVVGYDYLRGEPRGKFKKNQVSGEQGDCIDCGHCVRVCPTGIDIRNGTQLECVNCTACIDACDEVMVKIKRPKKLIKYASQDSLAEGTKFKITPRIILYTTVLCLLIGIVIYLLSTRSQVEATILRTKGSTYQKTDDDHYANIYTATIINKSFEPMVINLKLLDKPGHIVIVGDSNIKVKPEGIITLTFLLELEKELVKGTRNEIKIGVFNNHNLIQTVKTGFSGPIPGMDSDFDKNDEDHDNKNKDDEHK